MSSNLLGTTVEDVVQAVLEQEPGELFVVNPTADAWVFSTVRSRERGYLIYGSFILARADGEAEVARRVAEDPAVLERARRSIQRIPESG